MSCDYCWPGNCVGGPNCQADASGEVEGHIMRFAIVEPGETRWEVIEATSLFTLEARLRLDTPDHNVLVPAGHLPSGVGIGIVVDDFSMFVPPAEQRYFIIGRTLFAGNAVMYGFDKAGETVDLQEVPQVIFISLAGIEDAIANGQIERPRTTINGEEVWRWPGPSPFPDRT